MTPRESGSYRRESDPEDADYRDRRYGGGHRVIVKTNGSLQKWITGVVTAGIVTLLTVLIARDRKSVDDRLSETHDTYAKIMLRSAEHEAQIREIRVKQDRVLQDLAENGRKLDLLLVNIGQK